MIYYDLFEVQRVLQCDTFSEKSKYYSDIITFDIESTSLNKDVSFMYVWQMCVNGYSFYGRFWSEFVEFIDYLKTYEKNFIIWVHNLSFEFRFMEKIFDWCKVFATSPHKVVYADTDNIRFRCTYFMSNLSLAKLCSVYELPIQKLVGDLDYRLIRTHATELTAQELAYCENDVLILYYYIKKMLELYGSFNQSDMPLTSTGFTRKYLREHAEQTKTYGILRCIVKESTPTDLTLYNTLQRAFAGGYTHANYVYTGITLSNVRSYDKTSFYPAIMCKCKFPRKFRRIKAERFYSFIKKGYAVIADVCFRGLKPLTNQSVISEHKCALLKNEVTDNGRLRSADICVTTITELDFDTIKHFYTWDSITIGRCYGAIKRYLPKTIVECVLKLYSDKTQLKDLDGYEQEYQRLKALLNSLYGMCVTDIMQDMIVYRNGEWTVDKADETALTDYQADYKSILLYQTGVYVTAYARNELLQHNLILGDDVVYNDTDSIKFLNFDKYKSYFEEYDKKVLQDLKTACNYHKLNINLIFPKDKNGIVHPLGVMSDEGNYTKFKTLGCKRYIYEQKGKLKATVAGCPKKSVVDYLSTYPDAFSAFNNQMFIPSSLSGKNTHFYTECFNEIEVQDYQGNICKLIPLTGISLVPSTFEINLSAKYKAFLTTNIDYDGMSHLERQHSIKNYTKVVTLWD